MGQFVGQTLLQKFELLVVHQGHLEVLLLGLDAAAITCMLDGVHIVRKE